MTKHHIDLLYTLFTGDAGKEGANGMNQCLAEVTRENAPSFDTAPMDRQIEGWDAMADALSTQSADLEKHVELAKHSWNSEAGQVYFDNVEAARTAIETATAQARLNRDSWTRMRGEAQTAFDAVVEQKIQWDATRKAKMQEYEDAKAEDESKISVGDLFGMNDPEEPDYDSIREPYDSAASLQVEESVGSIDDTYAFQTFYMTEHQPPPDPGPQAPGDGGGGSGGSVPGGVSPGSPGSPGGGGPELQNPAPAPPPPPSAPAPPPPPNAPAPPPPGPMPPPPPPPPGPRPTPPPPGPRPTPPPGPRPTPPPPGPRPTPSPPGPRPTPPPVSRPPGGGPPPGGQQPGAPRPPGRTVPPVIGQRPGGPGGGGAAGTGPGGGGRGAMPPGMGGMRGGGALGNAARPDPVVRSVQPPVIGQRAGGASGTNAAGVRSNGMSPGMRPGKAGMDTRGVFGTRQSKITGAQSQGSGASSRGGAGVRAPVVKSGGDNLNRGVIRGAKQSQPVANTAPGASSRGTKREEERSATISSDGPLDSVFAVNQTVVPGVIRGRKPEETEHTAGPTIGDRPGKYQKKKKSVNDDWDDW